MPTVLDWSPTVDPSEFVRGVRETLAAGSAVVMPSDCGYAVLVNPAGPEAAAQLSSLAAASAAAPAVLAWGPDDPKGLGLGMPRGIYRLLTRGWPSPLMIELPGQPDWPQSWSSEVRSRAWAGERVRFRCPEHPLFDAVAPSLELPALVIDTYRPYVEEVFDLLDDEGAVGASTGERPVDMRPTLVTAVGGRPGWRITEPGIMQAEEVQRLAARIIMFVCTGNTCRSPLAECLAKKMLAERLGCSVEELPGRGFWVLSAGVSASSGCPAAAESAAVAVELGADLTGHESRLVNPQLLAAADDVIAMTRSHAQIIASRYPGVGPPPALLCGDEDLEDPIGAGLGVYRECARTIMLHLERRLSAWVGS